MDGVQRETVRGFVVYKEFEASELPDTPSLGPTIGGPVVRRLRRTAARTTKGLRAERGCCEHDHRD